MFLYSYPNYWILLWIIPPPPPSMAVDYPLVLYECDFDGLNWISESEEQSHVLSSLLQQWTQTAVKAQVLHGMIHGLQSTDTGVYTCMCVGERDQPLCKE